MLFICVQIAIILSYVNFEENLVLKIRPDRTAFDSSTSNWKAFHRTKKMPAQIYAVDIWRQS